jgi:hypothetical protein
MSDKISLIIPCLNEEKGLAKTLPKVPKIIDQILVVDGNSQDKTREVAKSFGADVFIEKRKGYGQALISGFENASGNVFICLDGDSTYPVEDSEKMYKYFLENKVDFLVACRFPLKHKNSMSVRNFFGNLFLSSFTSLIFNYQVTDVCSGMLMMKKQTWEKMESKIKNKKWFFSCEIKIEALKDRKIKYDEYWVELTERAGETKAGNPWLSGIKVLLRIVGKRLYG